jgi:hypothetical protein
VNRLFVGIDVGSCENTAHVMLPDGARHKAFAVHDSLGGAQTISREAVSALTANALPGVAIGVEAAGVCGGQPMGFVNTTTCPWLTGCFG